MEVLAGLENPLFRGMQEQAELTGGVIFIPLNGGSDTRRASREYWSSVARFANAKYECCGCFVRIHYSGNIRALRVRFDEWHRTKDSSHE